MGRYYEATAVNCITTITSDQILSKTRGQQDRFFHRILNLIIWRCYLPVMNQIRIPLIPYATPPQLLAIKKVLLLAIINKYIF